MPRLSAVELIRGAAIARLDLVGARLSYTRGLVQGLVQVYTRAGKGIPERRLPSVYSVGARVRVYYQGQMPYPHLGCGQGGYVVRRCLSYVT